MGPRDRPVVWGATGRRGNPISIPGLDDWLCIKCTEKQPDDGMQFFCRKNMDQCKCGNLRPKKPFRFCNSKCGKATAEKIEADKALANATAGRASAAPPKAGAGGAAADTKKDRDNQRTIAARDKRIADLEKELKKASSASSPTDDGDEEFQDANEGDEEAEGNKEDWQKEQDFCKGLLVTRRKELKDIKWPGFKEKAEEGIQEIEDRIKELTKFIQSAQSPQEQVQKKSARAKRMFDSLPGLMDQIRDEQESKQAAQEEVDKHTAEEIRLLDLHQWKLDEIARLNKETTEVCCERLGQAIDADQWMHKEVDEKLKVFDDPVFEEDATVKQKKIELQTTADSMRHQWTTFTAQLDFLVKHVAATSLQKTVDAKRKADEEAKAASAAAAEVAKKAEEAAKAAKKAEDDKRRKSEEDAKAAKKAEDDKKKKEVDEAKAATKKAEESTAASSSKTRVRGDDSRSPPPSKAFAKGASSASSSTTPQPQNVTDALAKKPRDRTDEEALLAASAAKASKKQNEAWADISDAPMEGNEAAEGGSPQQ